MGIFDVFFGSKQSLEDRELEEVQQRAALIGRTIRRVHETIDEVNIGDLHIDASTIQGYMVGYDEQKHPGETYVFFVPTLEETREWVEVNIDIGQINGTIPKDTASTNESPWWKFWQHKQCG